jgi:peptide-methionine (S)-S-oxide reductase
LEDEMSIERTARRGLFAATVLVFSSLAWHGGARADGVAKIAAPAFDEPAARPGTRETAVFAGGCFWGVQAVFQHTRGVLDAVSGYAGGRRETASYSQVSAGDSGHAESVQVTFDPAEVSYGKLLQVFFSVAHDPTQLDMQYPDTGSQYRSALFYSDATQKQVAERYIAQLEAAHAFASPIATRLAPLNGFYPAEAYHQDYATLHPHARYIETFDAPKLANLKLAFPQLYRERPALVGAAR